MTKNPLRCQSGRSRLSYFRCSFPRLCLSGMGVAFACLACGVGVALAQENQQQVPAPSESQATPQQLDFFEAKIRPVLVEHCYGCHSEEAVSKGKLKANLFLDTRDGMLRGGDTGPTLVAKQPEESLIIKALRYEDVEMPPSGKLSPAIIQDFTRWISEGAADPRNGTATKNKGASSGMSLEAGRAFWSLQPLHEVPPTMDGRHIDSKSIDANPIDAYIESALAAKQIALSPTADRRTLVRRAWFDLLGLPPSPQELDQALQVLEPKTGESGPISMRGWNELIDRLLARPEYGERWARHWMDIFRFAESFGYEQDYDRPNAYHYRDFLIKAFNADMPFDQFVRWQIAGDELAPDQPLAWMATGFLGAGAFPTQLTEKEFESTRYNELDDMTATAGVAFLGLSIGCARCHDHKFDPISSEDYYRFAASFSAAIRSEKTFDLHPEENLQVRKKYEQEVAELQNKIKEFEQKELPQELIQFIRSAAADNPSAARPWRSLTGEITASAGSKYQPQSDGSFLAIGEAPNQDTITFTAKLPAGTWKAIRIEALSDPSLPNQGPGRAGNGNFALGNLLVEQLPSRENGEPVKLVLTQPQATHQQNGDSLSVAASIDQDLVTGWAVDGQIGKSHAAVFHLAESVTTQASDHIRFTLRFHHPNPKHAMGRMRFSISSIDAPPVEVGSDAPPADVADAIEALTKSIGQVPASQIAASNDWKTALAWYRTISPTAKELDAKRLKMEKDGPPLRLTKVLVTTEGEPHLPHHADDRGYPHFYPETHLLRRGDVEQKVQVMKPGFPKVFTRNDDSSTDLSGSTLAWSSHKSVQRNPKSRYDRAALATWMTDIDAGSGALVARVISNRLWQHHFGRGIVASPNDFGTTGQKPTHPELLEWIASELVRNEWRLKPLHKALMTSKTYMQGNKLSNDPREKVDPENQLWWHRAPRRLEAESIRDSLLSVSGLLDRTMYGPGTLDPNMKRRSVYFFIKRSQLIPMMMLFDWPEHLVSIGQRQSTTIAPQALAFMNNPLTRAAAESLANQILTSQPSEGTSRENAVSQAIDLVFQRVLARGPSEQEREMGIRFLAQAEQLRLDQGGQEPKKMALADFCQLLFCFNEFVYVD